MGRQKNHIETETFTVSTTPQVVADLEELVCSGYYGKNVAEAAEYVMKESLKRIVLDADFNRLKKRRKQ